MSRTACTEPQCLYKGTLYLYLWSWKSRAIPLLPLWAVRPVQSLSACTRVHFTFFTVYLHVHRNSISIPSLNRINPLYTFLIHFNVLFSFCLCLFLGLANGCFLWGFQPKMLQDILTYVTTQRMFVTGFHPENYQWKAETCWYLLLVSFNICLMFCLVVSVFFILQSFYLNFQKLLPWLLVMSILKVTC